MYIDNCTYKRGDKTYSRALLRESYREDGKIKHRTIANLSKLSSDQIEGFKAVLAGKTAPVEQAVSLKDVPMKQGPSIGAVFALLTLAKRIGIAPTLGNSRIARLALWLICARVIGQGSRMSAVRLAEKHGVRELMGLSKFDEDDLYKALDWIADNQQTLEKQLFAKRFPNAKPQLFLYDVTSSYLEGTENELADWGYNRDKKRGKMQIVIGLLTAPNGIPVATRVFRGNTADPTTCLDQIKILAEQFGVKEVTLVGDRGMIKSLQIKELQAREFHYITAVTKAQIETLIKNGILQLDLFDEKLTEVTDGDVRYILRRNPLRAKEIADSRRDKYQTFQAKVEKANVYLKEHEKASAEIQLRDLTAWAGKRNLLSWLKLALDGRRVEASIIAEQLALESELDGCYALKTDLPAGAADAETVHARYKDLSQVEHAFRTMKTGLLEVRPVFVRKANRTRGHVFITALAYMIVHEIRRLMGTDSAMPIDETIRELTSLNVVELQEQGESFYRVPEPNDDLSRILRQLDVTIPPIIPKKGLYLV